MTAEQKLQKIKEIFQRYSICVDESFSFSDCAIAIEKIIYSKPQRLPFSWEQYISGSYIVVNPQSNKMKDIKVFDCEKYKYVGVADGDKSPSSYDEKDLFLIPIEPQPLHVSYFNEYSNGIGTSFNSIEGAENSKSRNAICITKRSYYSPTYIRYEVVKYYDK
jgi:hypothetical protein